jgi:phosphatidate cytidylyltransferase
VTWKRVATAAVLIPVVVALVLYASTAIVAIAVALVTLLSLFEYFALGDAIGHRGYRIWTATCSLLLVFVQWLPSVILANDFGGYRVPPRLVWLFSRTFPSPTEVLFIFTLGATAIVLGSKRPMVETLPALGISASGLLLVAFPLTFAVRMHGRAPIGPALLLFTLVITWAGDSAAYFVGRAFGRHPLAPHLSPKKTWEGSIASLLGSLLVGAAFGRALYAPLEVLLLMAAVGNIAGQAGDLLESAYKRSAGVKDSGGLLPGHGGMLDRIDALILAVPVVWYYWVWVYSPRL